MRYVFGTKSQNQVRFYCGSGSTLYRTQVYYSQTYWQYQRRYRACCFDSEFYKSGSCRENSLLTATVLLFILTSPDSSHLLTSLATGSQCLRLGIPLVTARSGFSLCSCHLSVCKKTIVQTCVVVNNTVCFHHSLNSWPVFEQSIHLLSCNCYFVNKLVLGVAVFSPEVARHPFCLEMLVLKCGQHVCFQKRISHQRHDDFHCPFTWGASYVSEDDFPVGGR